MKTLTTIIAITFTLFTATVAAQAKFINDGTVANNVTITNNEFQFEKNANGAVITWQTANESNCSQFELQISYDNKSFETIKTVAASDMTQWATNYEIKFRKTYLSAAKVYYRLRTVFTNGAEAFTSANAFQVSTGTAVSYASIH